MQPQLLLLALALSADLGASGARLSAAADTRTQEAVRPQARSTRRPSGGGESCKNALLAAGRAFAVTVLFSEDALDRACVRAAPVIRADDSASVETAVIALLAGTSLTLVKVDERLFVIVPRIEAAPVPAPPFLNLTTRSVAVAYTPSRAIPLARVGMPDETGVVEGEVRDAKTGSPIALVTVVLQEAKLRAHTDDAGRFRLVNVPPGRHELVATLIGFRRAATTIMVQDGAATRVSLTMERSPVLLDQLITTATGTVRSVEVGHAIGRIHAPDIVGTAPIKSLSNLLEARVPGVQISGYTGATGESPVIRIRGLSSISKSRDPLIFVDGVRVENSAISSPARNLGFSAGRLNDFRPEEMEDIEIVKGPSAATLYGTDAANGVILITTKMGRPGQFRWDISAEGGTLAPSVDFEDTYYSWGTNRASGSPQRCLLVQKAAGVCTVDSLTHFNPLNNPETTPIGMGYRSQTGIRGSGGAGPMAFFISGAWEQETNYLRMPAAEVKRLEAERGASGIPDEQMRPNSLSRLNLRANTTVQLGPNASATWTNALATGTTHMPGAIYYTYVSALWAPGYRDSTYNGWFQRYGRPGEIFAMTEAEKLTRYTSSLAGKWQARSWLSTRATLGLDFSDVQFDGLELRNQGTSFRQGYRLNIRTIVPLVTADLGSSAEFALTPVLSSRSSVGLQYSKRAQRREQFDGTGLASGGRTISGATLITASETTDERVVAGGFFEQMFGLHDRVFVTGAVRADGGSSFGRNFNTAIYPKASLSWLTFDQSSTKRPQWADRLRMRVAFGASGVQPGSTDALPLYSRFATIVNGASSTAAALLATGNADLKPERSSEFEGGLDLDLLDRRVSVEATYYSRMSRDALIQRPLPTSSGLSSQWINVGALSNKGVELTVDSRLLDTRNIDVSLTLSGSNNANKLVDLGIPKTIFIGSLTSTSRTGYPILSRWAKPILGYSDANANGILEPTEVQVGDTAVFIGPSMAPRQATIAPSLALFGGVLELRSLFHYRGGQTGYDATPATGCKDFPSCRAVNDPAAPLADQAAAVAWNSYNTLAGYFQDASYWRWREASVTYQAPTSIARQVARARSLALSVSGRNLWLWSRFGYPDPEGNYQVGDNTLEGTVTGTNMPQTRYWVLRVNLQY